MEKKFTVLIHDDWELQGNGLGNVASHQYIPSSILMKIAKKLDIQLTFMVEVAQQLEFAKQQHCDANIRVQKNLWDDTVLLMKDYGFDVQLHLHPQWLNASLKQDLFYLNDNWNIGRYDSTCQKTLIQSSINYLHQLIRPYDSNYNVIAFKGGSWGLQPSESLFKTLESEGVKIVMGVRNGMQLSAIGVDYRNSEEDLLPYYPMYKDIKRKSSKQEKIFIIPLLSYKPGLKSLLYLTIDYLKKKVTVKSTIKYFYSSQIDDKILNLAPIKDNKFTFSLSPYHTHLKIGNQPFQYLKYSFDSTLKKFDRIEATNIPILIECHTKQLHNHYSDIERFLSYIQNKYHHSIDFKDLTSFYTTLNKDSLIV